MYVCDVCKCCVSALVLEMKIGGSNCEHAVVMQCHK